MQDGIFHTSLGGKVGIAPAATRLEGGISFYPKPWVEPVASLDVRGGSYFHGGNGDVSGDGVVSQVDLLRIVNWLSGATELTPEEYARADINGDGSVNSIDYFLLLDVIEKDITIEQAHHSVGKQKNDSSLVTTLTGDIGIGMSSPTSMNPSNRLEISKNINVRMTFKRVDASITAGNGLGRISFTGTDGASETNPHVGSYIQGSASGNPWNTSQSPGDLTFYTTPKGTIIPLRRMRIYHDGLVEIAGQLKIKGGSPVKGKFLKAADKHGKAEWDYWPGDHLWGQGRPGIVVKDTSGECTVGDLKISRSIPSVEWEGAAASCPKGWWVCTADERGTGTCGTSSYIIRGCYPNYTNYGDSISAPTVYFYKSGAAHLNELSAGTLWTFGYQTDFRNGVWKQEGVINAWVADAYYLPPLPSNKVAGKSVSINGVTSEGDIVCERYPVWCCANK
jgi:hypothetical protein